MSAEVGTGEGREPSRWLEFLWVLRAPYYARARELHLLTSDVELSTTTTMFSISPPLSPLPPPYAGRVGQADALIPYPLTQTSR